MKVRYCKPSDVPKLKAMHSASGFEYEFPDLDSPMIEAILVVTDENDEPVMSAISERLTQLYLLSGQLPPAMKLHAIRLLHETMAEVLRAKGYRSVEAFLPPQIERSFGRRLMRTFNWWPNWASFSRKV